MLCQSNSIFIKIIFEYESTLCIGIDFVVDCATNDCNKYNGIKLL